MVKALQDIDIDLNDSITEFKSNLRELMPNFQSGNEAVSVDNLQETRKNERQKKPSSRFNEEAGYLVKPLILAKKKGACRTARKVRMLNLFSFLIG